MADMIKVKDFAKNFGLDIKDATKIIEDSGLLGSAQIGESVEISVINTVVNKITLDNQTKIEDYLKAGEKKEKKVEKPAAPKAEPKKEEKKIEKPVEAKKPVEEKKQEAKVEHKPEIKADTKPAAPKTEAKPEVKTEPKPERQPERDRTDLRETTDLSRDVTAEASKDLRAQINRDERESVLSSTETIRSPLTRIFQETELISRSLRESVLSLTESPSIRISTVITADLIREASVTTERITVRDSHLSPSRSPSPNQT